jgi:hypothetical protein
MISIVARLFVIVLVSCKATYVNNPENQELVTLIECIFAGGYHVFLMITFKGVYYLWKYFKNDTDGNIF